MKICNLLATSLLLFSGTTFAESNVDVITTISVGTSNIDFDIFESFYLPTSSNNGDTRTINASAKTPVAEIGVTVIDESTYYGFTALISGQTVSDFQLDIYSAFSDSTTRLMSQELTSRSSNSLFLGYSVIDNLSLYGGITSGTSSFGSKVRSEESGPFIGGRYALRFGSTSSLSIDLSYSLMQIDTTLANGNFVGAEHLITSDSHGFSYSLTWLKSLDRGRSFFIRYKVVNLIFDGSTSIQELMTSNFGTARMDGDQKLTTISLGMGF